MNYESRLEIMMAAIKGSAMLPENLERPIRDGIIDGFLRIERVQMEEKRAAEPCFYVPVERVQEGYGFWNSGGYDSDRRIGRSEVAAGADGERLKQVRYLAEKNGRHSLAVVYPGCFVAVGVAHDVYECDNVSVYQIIGFSRTENGFQARCKKVLQMEPRISVLTKEQEDRLARIIGVANKISIYPDLLKLRNWV